MTTPTEMLVPTPYWYQVPGRIEHQFYGVFEGGGAKGLAYVGALQAMAAKKCWFRGVAGASAGAITAALVAAGASPEDIYSETDNALKKLQTRKLSGALRLRGEAGYFSSDGLRDWLKAMLGNQVKLKTGLASEVGATFEELFQATGIELNIVAADLSARCHVIFSHIETPKCSVADAVVASSSIPFAFPSCVLQVGSDGDDDSTSYHHTIVDGGVWSNFPIYIFEDEAFREMYKRQPPTIKSEEILGFVLQEVAGGSHPEGRQIRFVQSPAKFRAPEWETKNRADNGTSPNFVMSFFAVLLYPISLVGRAVDWNSGMEPGRWPTPRSRAANYLVHGVNGLLGGIYPPFFAVLAFVLIAIGAYSGVDFVIRDVGKAMAATDWSDPYAYPGRIISLGLVVLFIFVAILLLFGTLVGIIANQFLLRASRRLLYGLATTFVAGAGAPAWSAVKKNVVSLPIPENVSTLSFNLKAAARDELIDGARQATLKKLDWVLGSKAGGSSAP